ncbi:uncharacterized protein LOC144709477 [Wolffia australiana]
MKPSSTRQPNNGGRRGSPAMAQAFCCFFRAILSFLLSRFFGFFRILGFSDSSSFSIAWSLKEQLLRITREKKMEGIVMFAYDSNVHSQEMYSLEFSSILRLRRPPL